MTAHKPKRRRILVVEDSLFFRTVLVDLLAEHGYEPYAAETLQSAGEMLDELTPDLVLLDLQLPDGDGRGFIRAFRQRRSDIPLIVVSGTRDAVDKVHCLTAGASDYVTKPIVAEELLARIDAQLRARRLARPPVESVQTEQARAARWEFELGLPNANLLEDLVAPYWFDAVAEEQPVSAVALCFDGAADPGFDSLYLILNAVIRRRCADPCVAVRMPDKEILIVLPGKSQREAMNLWAEILGDFKASLPADLDFRRFADIVRVGVSGLAVGASRRLEDLVGRAFASAGRRQTSMFEAEPLPRIVPAVEQTQPTAAYAYKVA